MTGRVKIATEYRSEREVSEMNEPTDGCHTFTWKVEDLSGMVVHEGAMSNQETWECLTFLKGRDRSAESWKDVDTIIVYNAAMEIIRRIRVTHDERGHPAPSAPEGYCPSDSEESTAAGETSWLEAIGESQKPRFSGLPAGWLFAEGMVINVAYHSTTFANLMGMVSAAEA